MELNLSQFVAFDRFKFMATASFTFLFYLDEFTK